MSEAMDKNTENLGKVTFKVKLDQTYHDFVLEWSEESQSYGGQQLFEQLESISGIPIKYTYGMQIYGNGFAHRNPFRPDRPIFVANPEAKHVIDSTHMLCNRLAAEVIRCKNQFDCDLFALILRLMRIDGRFHIYYELRMQTVVPETECLNFCPFRNTKVFLDKMRSIILNDKLNSQINDLLSATDDTVANREIVYRNFNICQYHWRPCSGRLASAIRRVQTEFLGYRHKHLYLRTRG